MKRRIILFLLLVWVCLLQAQPTTFFRQGKLPDADGNSITLSCCHIARVAVTQSLQIINTLQGRSYVSSCPYRLTPDFATMVEEFMETNNLMIIRGVHGSDAPSPHHTNTFVDWSVFRGCKERMKAPDKIIVSDQLLFNKTVNFAPGFHRIPVLTNESTLLIDVFSDPQNVVFYLVDIYINLVCWPGGGITSLTQLVPG